MLDYQLTEDALSDLDKIADWSLEKFGVEALDRYAHLIDTVIEQLRENPEKIGVNATLKGLHKYHLDLSKNDAPLNGQIVKKPRHLVFFHIIDGGVLEIVRILKDDMDFKQHL